METIERRRTRPRTERGTGRGKRGFKPSRPTTAQQAILAHLNDYGHPWLNRSFLRGQAERHGQVTVGAFARQLRAMVHAEVIEVREVGGEIQYRLKEETK